MKTDCINKIRDYAISCHAARNQLYGNLHTYSYHLGKTAEIAENFIWMIPDKDQEDVICGAWCHDLIEDTGETYNDVKKATNETVAEYSFALANEKGRTRKDRANDKYYKGIREYKHSIYVKLCDRIANVEFSKSQENKRMFEMYKKEMPEFKEKLYDGRFDELWLALKLLLE